MNHEQPKVTDHSLGGILGSYQPGVIAYAGPLLQQLSILYTKFSNQYGELFRQETHMEQVTANQSAQASVKNGHDQMVSTIFGGISDILSATGILAGSASGCFGGAEEPNLSSAEELQSNLAPSEEEETNVSLREEDEPIIPEGFFDEEPTDEDKEPLKAKLTSLTEKVEAVLRGEQVSLTPEEIEDIQTLKQTYPDETAALNQQLEDHITTQKENYAAAVKARNDKIAQRETNLQYLGRGLGSSIGSPGAGIYQNKQGHDQAAITQANGALQMAQNGAQQYSGQANTLESQAAQMQQEKEQMRSAARAG